MPFKFILSGFFLLCFFVCGAQNWDYSYTHYTKEDGLPSNTIYCVTSDRDGVLWLGTDAGVVRFDGFHMRVFNTDDGLPSNDVFEIVCDSKNRLWLTTIKNDIVYIFRGKIHTSKNDLIIQKIHNSNSDPRYFEDSDSNIWVRTRNFSLFKISNKNSVSEIKFPFKLDENYNVTELNKKLYFISANHTIAMNVKNSHYDLLVNRSKIKVDGLSVHNGICYTINSQNLISVVDSAAILQGKITGKSLNWNFQIADSNIWLLSKNGFRKIRLNNLSTYDTFLTTRPVTFFHQDNYGNKWIATLSDGLYQLNSLIVKNIYNANKNFLRTCFSLYVEDNEIFVGSMQGEVIKIDRKSLEKLDFLKIDISSLSSYRILKIISSHYKKYVLTDRGLFFINNNIFQPVNSKMIISAPKNIILKTDSLVILDYTGISFYNKSSYKFIDSVGFAKRCYSYCTYHKKHIVGSQDSLYYIDKTFKPYPLNINFNFRAVDLLVKDSFLVATTSEKGVFLIKDSTVVKNLNSSNGFSSNTCYKSVLYKNELYTATNKGINIYNFEKDSLFYLFESDGLPSNTVFDISILNDTIYAATESGLSIIPVNEIPHHRTFPLFAKPIIAHRDTLWDRPASISLYHEQPITLFLNALSYGTKSPVQYFYKVSPRDTAFNTTSDPTLHLTNIPHGEYTFYAYAINSEGVKSNALEITLNVRPYFYQTKIFYACVIFLFCLFLAFVMLIVFKTAQQYEQKRTRQERQVRGLQFLAWKSAVNPHFLFNSLQSIQSLYAQNKMQEANLFTKNFSNVLRKTIDQSENVFTQINIEIDYLQSYLELEVLKSLDTFQYSIKCDMDAIGEYYIPSMVLQIVVENSIKHGIADITAGSIEVFLWQKENHIICTIRDNGKGFKEAAHDKKYAKGIALIKTKLNIVEELIKQQIEFKYHNLTNQAGMVTGAETIFKFPILTTSYEIPFSDH